MIGMLEQLFDKVILRTGTSLSYKLERGFWTEPTLKLQLKNHLGVDTLK